MLLLELMKILKKKWLNIINNTIYPSIKPTIAPSILEGIISINVASTSFDITFVIPITISNIKNNKNNIIRNANIS